MKTYEFWQSRGNGEIWAIEFRDGVVAACCGPLEHNEVAREYLEGYDYSSARAADMEARRDEFEFVDDESLLVISMGGAE